MQDKGASVNPEMIVLARQSRGLTQLELASRLGVTQGWLSRVESGLRDVSRDKLTDLARELGYPIEFFFQQDKVYGFGITELFHRKFQDIPSKTLDILHAKTNIRSMHIKRMLRGVDLGTDDFPSWDPGELDGNVESLAQALRARWSLPRGPVQNLVRTIEDARGVVVALDFGTRRVDAISRVLPEKMRPVFFINSSSPGDRLRFTLCHELGHIVLHRQNAEPSRIEEEADRFAAEFLMPAKDIRPQLYDLNLERLALLKLHWKVSMAAILKRATDLGAIAQRQARFLWMQMSKAGYRTREPANLDIPIETPSLQQEIVEVHRRDMGYTVSEFAALINLSEQETRDLYFSEHQDKHLRVVR